MIMVEPVDDDTAVVVPICNETFSVAKGTLLDAGTATADIETSPVDDDEIISEVAKPLSSVLFSSIPPPTVTGM